MTSITETHSWFSQATMAFTSLKFCMWKKANIIIHQDHDAPFPNTNSDILLYGSETWTLLKSDMNKLEVFQMLLMTSPGSVRP